MSSCNNSNPSAFKLHAAYVIGILVAIILGLITQKFGENETLTNYINFALGLTSFVLGIVAIFHSLLTSNSFNQTAAKIDTAASAIRDESGRLEASVSTLNAQLNTLPTAIESGARAIKEEAARLEASVTSLNTHLTSIPEAIKLVEGKVNETHDLIRLSSQQAKTEKAADQPKITSNLPESYYKNFLRVSSNTGLKVLYLWVSAFEKKKSFNLNAWSEQNKYTNPEYVYGFTVAASAAGLFDYELEEDPKKSLAHVLTLAVELPPLLKTALEERFKLPEEKEEIEELYKNTAALLESGGLAE